MKKFIFSLVVVATLAVAFLGTTGFVYAQAPVPPTPQTPGSGPVAGRGMRGGAGAATAGTGYLQSDMDAAFAQKLGISVADLNARIAKGETVAQIAASKGYNYEQFRTLMTEARNQAVAQAAASGKITQPQADWMKQRSANMPGGYGMAQQNGDCPYFPAPTK